MVFLDMISCTVVEQYQHLRGKYWKQGQSIPQNCWYLSTKPASITHLENVSCLSGLLNIFHTSSFSPSPSCPDIQVIVIKMAELEGGCTLYENIKPH